MNDGVDIRPIRQHMARESTLETRPYSHREKRPSTLLLSVRRYG